MKKILMMVLFCVLVLQHGYAQSPIITPAPGNYTVCPREDISYSVIPGPNFSGCGSFTWTITKGSFAFGAIVTTTTVSSATESVHVWWDDETSTGTLKVTSTCSTGGALTATGSYAIRSLKGRMPNASTSGIYPYCDASSITLFVQEMFLENTGGTTGVTQQRADGYEWVLPAGWKSSGASGTVTSTAPSLNITPDDGCSGGTVSVKAFMSCGSGRKYSNPANIDLNRQVTLTVTSPNYSVGRCGNTQAVMFNVTAIPCATDYKWNFSGPDGTPSGWSATYISSGANNYLNIAPSGGSADAGAVTVTVTLSCGKVLSSTPFTLSYSPPSISGPNIICGSGAFEIQNTAGVPVNWSTSNTNILTINASGGATRGSSNGSVTVSGSFGCGSKTETLQKTVWVGGPNFVTPIEGPSQVIRDLSARYTVDNARGATGGYSWSIDEDWRIYTSGPIGGGQSATIVAGSSSGVYLSVRTSNSCGSGSTSKFIVRAGGTGGGGGGGGGCDPQVTAYPNPAKGGNVVINIIPPPGGCDPVMSTSASKSADADYLLLVRNASGEKVLEKTFSGDETQILTPPLEPGLYYVKIQYKGRSHTKKIIIE